MQAQSNAGPVCEIFFGINASINDMLSFWFSSTDNLQFVEVVARQVVGGRWLVAGGWCGESTSAASVVEDEKAEDAG